MGTKVWLAIGAVVAVLVSAVATAAAGAATTTVPCVTGQNGLVSAVQHANTNADPDVIVLEAGCTYSLAGRVPPGPNGLPQIASPVTIQGNGATIVRTSGMDLRIFEVLSGGSLTVDRLTMAGGHVTTHGGGILNNAGGTLVVTNSVITGNHVVGALNAGSSTGFGGGLANFGTASLTRVSVHSNSVTSASDTSVVIALGGGISTQSGTLALDSVVIRDNTATATAELGASFIHAQGGGLAARSAPVTGTRVTIMHNRAVADGVSSTRTVYGGGLSAEGPVSLTSSTVHDNVGTGTDQAFGGGVYMHADLTLTTVTIFDNVASAPLAHGGGMWAKSGTLTASDLSVYDNTPTDCENVVC